MFLPILSYDDGYGFTYGGRVSTIGLLGGGERLSVPLTWGGTRRAAVEARAHVQVRAAHAHRVDLRHLRSARTRTSRSTISASSGRRAPSAASPAWCAPASTRRRARWTSVGSTIGSGPFGADVALDTRGDPAFPRNAVLLGAGWTGLHVRRLDHPIEPLHRPRRAATSGLIASGGARRPRAVLHGRPRRCPTTNGCCSAAPRTCAGSAPARSTAIGMLVTSAELRVPITSVLSGAKLGLTAFMDAGKAFEVGAAVRRTPPGTSGVGGGVFLIATIVRINLDVAHGLKTGDTRVHLSSGFQFLVGLDGSSQLLSMPAATATEHRSDNEPDVGRAARRAGACTTGTSTRRS